MGSKASEKPRHVGVSLAQDGARSREGLRVSDRPRATRLRSLDVFRGFVILSMLFVNLLSDMPHAPRVLLHAAREEDTCTYADLVFPGFLFVVGIAIPLSLRWVLDTGGVSRALVRLSTRALSLLVAGVVLEFHGDLDATNTGLSERTWMLLFYAALMLAWQTYRPDSRLRGLRYVGLLGIAFLVAIFRGPDGGDGRPTLLAPQWWGILGLIGWAYLECSVVYLCARGRDLWLWVAFVLMLALYEVDSYGGLGFVPPWVFEFVGLGPVFGSTAANAMAGVIVGNLFVHHDSLEPGARVRLMGLFALGLFAAGWLLRPLHGIHKIGATESYALVASGLCCAAFALFYALIDLRGQARGVALLGQLGQNALLAYIMPGLFACVLEALGLYGSFARVAYPFYESAAPLACLNALAAALFFSGLTVLLGRTGLTLRF